MRKKASVIAAAAIFCFAVFLSACKGGADTEESKTEATTSSTVTITENDAASTNTTQQSSSDTVTETDGLPAESENNDTNLIVQTAKTLIGIPFATNGSTPTDGFDNSGFIYYVLRENGFVNCPRMTSDQANMGGDIGYSELRSGDLAFFSTGGSGNPDFGGIYIGGGMMIFSPMPGQKVREVDITTDYWRDAFVKGISLQNS